MGVILYACYKRESCAQLEFNRRQHTEMLLLDAQQAFDRVWHDSLVHKLIELHFPNNLIAVTQSFLSNRTIRVKVGDLISNPLTITAGFPQGSKTLPCLFNIFCHANLQSEGILTAQYADYVAVLYSTKQIGPCSQILNRYVSVLLQWL